MAHSTAKLTIGSRGSKLALWQANWVRARLLAAGHRAEIAAIRTSGDRMPRAALTSSGIKGLFIKEIEEALAAGAIDLAVHSLKDLPVDQPEGLLIGAVPLRADARDALISQSGQRLAELPRGARVGTSSLRRASQLRALRRDLAVEPVRGNVDTRLRKLERGDYDALVLAAAGLERLGLAGRVTERLAVEDMCPAAGQGALAIEIRRGDKSAAEAVGPLDDAPTRAAVRAERALLRALGGGCDVPIAANARIDGNELRLIGVVASADGSKVVRASGAGPSSDCDELGGRVARELLALGARGILTPDL